MSYKHWSRSLFSRFVVVRSGRQRSERWTRIGLMNNTRVERTGRHWRDKWRSDEVNSNLFGSWVEFVSNRRPNIRFGSAFEYSEMFCDVLQRNYFCFVRSTHFLPVLRWTPILLMINRLQYKRLAFNWISVKTVINQMLCYVKHKTLIYFNRKNNSQKCFLR